MGGIDFTGGKLLGGEEAAGHLVQLVIFLAVGGIKDQVLEIGVVVGAGELQHQVKQVNGFIGFEEGFGEIRGGNMAGLDHPFQHAMHLGAAHQVAKDPAEGGAVGEIFLVVDGIAEINEANTFRGNDHVVEAQIQVGDARLGVHHIQQFGALEGKIKLGNRFAAIAQPVNLQEIDITTVILLVVDGMGDAAAIFLGEHLLQTMHQGHFAGKEDGEDVTDQRLPAAFHFLIGHVRVAMPQTVENPIQRREALGHHVLAMMGFMADAQFHFEGEAISKGSLGDVLHLAGGEKVHFAGNDGPEFPAIGDRAGRFFDLETVPGKLIRHGLNLGKRIIGINKLATPADQLENGGRIMLIGIGGKDKIRQVSRRLRNPETTVFLVRLIHLGNDRF